MMMLCESERKNFLTALLLMAVTALSACGDSDHTEAASIGSQDFMSAYYQQNNANSALRFTTGDARDKINKEISAAAKSGTGSNNPDQLPTVVVSFDTSKETSKQQYDIAWKVQSSAGQKLKVTTTMVKLGERWLVTKFIENKN